MPYMIYPCVWYNQQSEEAAKTYCSLVKDASILQSNPMATYFQIGKQRFIGLNGGPEYTPNPSISFFWIFDTEAEVNHAWKVLSNKGKVLMDLNSYPWNKRYGWVEDQYNVSWQLMVKDDTSSETGIFPALMFTGKQNGNAEKAMEFYTSLFPSSAIDSVYRYEADDHDQEGNIKHAEFHIAGFKMAAFDSSLEHTFSFNEGVSLVIECEDQAEIDHYWNSFTKNGKEDQCGWCKDQYGVSWQVIPKVLSELMNDPQKAPKAVQAFLKMKKFDIEALVSAVS